MTTTSTCSRHALSGAATEVLAVEDSEQGCKLAVAQQPDVILMGLEMTVMDRWEPVRRLKKDPRTRDIPIIGMSANAIASEREQAIATGCDEFDPKPIEFEGLVATIRRVTRKPKIAVCGRASGWQKISTFAGDGGHLFTTAQPVHKAFGPQFRRCEPIGWGAVLPPLLTAGYGTRVISRRPTIQSLSEQSGHSASRDCRNGFISTPARSTTGVRPRRCRSR